MKSGKFVVYKSSAGSGKTYTLVKEYLKLALADADRLHISFKYILAVTFTNKAATEMKERVLRALAEISAGNDTPLAADLQREMGIPHGELQVRCEELLGHLLHQYADLAVCTIDSFVYRIVRRFSLDLKLPANFVVETDEETPLWWAIDNLLTDMQQNAAVRKLLESYAGEKVDEQKNWNIEQEIFDLAKSVLVSKKDNAGAGLLQQQEIDKLVEVKDHLREKMSEVEQHLTKLADSALSLLDSKGLDPTEFFQGKKGIPGYFNKIRGQVYDSDDLINQYVRKALEEDVWYSGKKANPRIDAVKNDLLQIINDIESYREKEGKRYYLHALLLKNINALCVLSEVKLLVDQYKQEKNIVFISEFNKAVAGFISQEPVPYIYERLGDRYKHYLVDEFQDTSAMQWLNLLPLVHNSLSEGKFCMLVGDGKQSIYRWRGADVEQFTNLPRVENKDNSAWIKEQEQALQSEYVEKHLSINRRSCAEVIRFNNGLFEFLSGSLLEGPYRKVYANCAQEAASKEGGLISLQFLREEKKEGEERMLEEVFRRVSLSRANDYRYADIAVLVRKNRHGNLIANHLLKCGIPVISSDSLLLKGCPEVNLVNAFLTWLINPNDAVAATAVLGYLGESAGNIQAFASRTLGFLELLAKRGIRISTQELLSLSLYELCTAIIRAFGIEERNPLYLNFYLDVVADFSQRESNSVFEFLSWWKQKCDTLSVKIPANTNAVRILTIHSSKGLEFPVVIFPFADWKVDNAENILIETGGEVPHLPVALVKTGSLLKKTAFEERSVQEEQRQKLDNMNLLYVACTRAVDELHVISRIASRGGGRTVANWLKDFAEQEHGLAGDLLELGEQPERAHAETQENTELRHASYRPIHDAVTIKLSDQEDSLSSRRVFGIAIHNILAEISTAEDISPALQKALLQGNINADQLPELQTTLDALVAEPRVGKYFSKEHRVRTETELFLNNGDIVRPDRVVICEDHLAVIDFKTGEKKPEHAKQIEQYRYALKNISGKEVKAFLVYLPLEVVEV